MDNLGKTGEKHAVNFLKQNGYRIQQCNWKCPLGEIDIIASDRDILCIIEVKTRQDQEFGGPWDAINDRKKHKISKLAQWYCSQKGIKNRSLRFDVVLLWADSDGKITNTELLRDAIRL
ncbi:YraN family protein [bacterium Unc6]|nr:YraN family protein [bacterium Unc6]